MIVLYADGFINTDAKECISCDGNADSPYQLLCEECREDAEDSRIFAAHKQELGMQSDNDKHLLTAKYL